MKKTSSGGSTAKHTGTRKHTSTKKHHPVHHRTGATAHGHHVTTKAKHPSHAKARALALGEGVACCSAESLAASLRLAGARVDDDDVLALHWAAGGDADTGVPILAALAAAARFGLAGCWPAFAPAIPVGSAGIGSAELIDGHRPGPILVGVPTQPFPGAGEEVPESAVQRLPGIGVDAHGLILGVDLPGPHAVTVDDRGRWWSWGEPYGPASFPRARIEECWAVTWS